MALRSSPPGKLRAATGLGVPQHGPHALALGSAAAIFRSPIFRRNRCIDLARPISRRRHYDPRQRHQPAHIHQTASNAESPLLHTTETHCLQCGRCNTAPVNLCCKQCPREGEQHHSLRHHLIRETPFATAHEPKWCPPPQSSHDDAFK